MNDLQDRRCIAINLLFSRDPQSFTFHESCTLAFHECKCSHQAQERLNRKHNQKPTIWRALQQDQDGVDPDVGERQNCRRKLVRLELGGVERTDSQLFV